MPHLMHAFLQLSGDVAAPSVKRRILIVDDHRFFAACLRALVDNEADLAVCDVMTSSADLRERIARLQPDVLVIDLSLGEENGLEVARRLRGMGILTPVLFVSTLAAPGRQLAAIPHAAFVAKGKTPAEFLVTLRGVLGSPPGAAGGASSRATLASASSNT